MNLTIFRELTKFEETLYGLPLLFTGGIIAFLYYGPLPLSFGLVLWILLAFVSARVSGMAFNRWIDREIDSKNSRTKNRALPAERVKTIEVQVLSWISLGIFLFSAAQINLLTLSFSPLVAFCLFCYSYTKRWSFLCHFILGFIHLLSPLMVWMALTNTLAWPPILLGLSIFLTISSHDIIYGLQDLSFDRKNRLQSVPSKFGIKSSLMIAKIMDGLSFCTLFVLGLQLQMSMVYFIGIFLIGIFFIYFHLQIQALIKSPKFKYNLPPLFFLSNVGFSATLFVFTSLELVWRAI